MRNFGKNPITHTYKIKHKAPGAQLTERQETPGARHIRPRVQLVTCSTFHFDTITIIDICDIPLIEPLYWSKSLQLQKLYARQALYVINVIVNQTHQ